MELLANINSPDVGAPKALDMLKKAVSILVESENKENPLYQKLLAITLNNVACYYKRYLILSHRFSKPNVALKYLNSVLSIEKSLDESDISIARTHLNICAIESLLGR